MSSTLSGWTRGLLVVACILVLAADPGVAAQQVEVRAIKDAYAPTELTVAAGTQIRFLNDDDDFHTVTARDGSWTSPMMTKGETWTQTFSVAGSSHEYYCIPHPWMVGTIAVQ